MRTIEYAELLIPGGDGPSPRRELVRFPNAPANPAVAYRDFAGRLTHATWLLIGDPGGGGAVAVASSAVAGFRLLTSDETGGAEPQDLVFD